MRWEWCGDTRGTALVCRGVDDQLKSLRRPARWGPRGCSAVGSAQPCQGWGREFESRHPLECSALSRRNPGERTARGVKPHGGVAERLGTGLQSRLHGFESRRHLQALHSQLNPLVGAIGAAVARFPDTEEVTGSIPVSRTEKPPEFRGFSAFGVLLVLELSHVARSVARMKPFATVRWREANPERACGPCQGP